MGNPYIGVAPSTISNKKNVQIIGKTLQYTNSFHVNIEFQRTKDLRFLCTSSCAKAGQFQMTVSQLPVWKTQRLLLHRPGF